MSEVERDCHPALDRLLSGAEELGLDLSDEAQRRFEEYCVLLREENRRVNLTGVRDAEGIMRILFLDSLTVLPPLREHLPGGGQRLVADVGAGAGIPGLPVKIMRPDWRLALIESVGKKARFLQSAVDTLQLAGVTVLNERAEETGWRKELRDTADACVARAVAPLAVLVELCAPLVRTGGVLVFPKSGNVDPEIAEAEVAAHKLRTQLLECRVVPETLGLGPDRYIVLYRKTGETPPGYPRRVGLARSRPLGS